MNFAKFLRTPFFTEHLRWLLLRLTVMNAVALVFLIAFYLVYLSLISSVNDVKVACVFKIFFFFYGLTLL